MSEIDKTKYHPVCYIVYSQREESYRDEWWSPSYNHDIIEIDKDYTVIIDFDKESSSCNFEIRCYHTVYVCLVYSEMTNFTKLSLSMTTSEMKDYVSGIALKFLTEELCVTIEEVYDIYAF
jgi:hypothetical protein